MNVTNLNIQIKMNLDEMVYKPVTKQYMILQ